jgi:hypothetical protein
MGRFFHETITASECKGFCDNCERIHYAKTTSSAAALSHANIDNNTTTPGVVFRDFTYVIHSTTHVCVCVREREGER